METIKKITKRAKYAALKSMVAAAAQTGLEFEVAEGIDYDMLNAFIDHEVELLDGKAAAATARNAKKKEQGDELRERIYELLSETDFALVREIVAALDDPDISAQMVTARLTQLVKLGRVEKTEISVAPVGEGGKSKRLAAYKKIG